MTFSLSKEVENNNSTRKQEQDLQATMHCSLPVSGNNIKQGNKLNIEVNIEHQLIENHFIFSQLSKFAIQNVIYTSRRDDVYYDG